MLQLVGRVSAAWRAVPVQLPPFAVPRGTFKPPHGVCWGVFQPPSAQFPSELPPFAVPRGTFKPPRGSRGHWIPSQSLNARLSWLKPRFFAVCGGVFSASLRPFSEVCVSFARCSWEFPCLIPRRSCLLICSSPVVLLSHTAVTKLS